LNVALSSNPSFTQEETVTVVVDSTLPMINISQPVSNAYYINNFAVTGTINDVNIMEYSVSYSGAVGTVLVDKANQNREDYTFGILNNLPEGNYMLNAVARDFGENLTEINIPFTIDMTQPNVVITTPVEGEYYGSARNIITITGSIVEMNLDTYSLRYGSGENPEQWTELLTGNTVPTNPQLFLWDVSSIADGIYTISLFAQDKAGLTGEAQVMVSPNPPSARIASQRNSSMRP